MFSIIAFLFLAPAQQTVAKSFEVLAFNLQLKCMDNDAESCESFANLTFPVVPFSKNYKVVKFACDKNLSEAACTSIGAGHLRAGKNSLAAEAFSLGCSKGYETSCAELAKLSLKGSELRRILASLEKTCQAKANTCRYLNLFQIANGKKDAGIKGLDKDCGAGDNLACLFLAEEMRKDKSDKSKLKEVLTKACKRNYEAACNELGNLSEP